MKNIIKNPIKILWLAAAFISMALGAIGVILPVLPTTPFLLLASFCFAKGSERFHKWFTKTKLYKKHLDSFVKNRAMTLKTKLCILIPASCMLVLAMIAMSNIYGRVFIVFLIIFKYVYFFTKIQTIPSSAKIETESGRKDYFVSKCVVNHTNETPNIIQSPLFLLELSDMVIFSDFFFKSCHSIFKHFFCNFVWVVCYI